MRSGERDMRCVLILGILSFSCGNTSQTAEPGPGGGEAEADAEAGDYVEALMASWELICREVERCYPALQSNPAQCVAPGDEGRTVVWTDVTAAASEAELTQVETCLRGVEDQAALQAWVECFVPAEESEASCLASCPASAEACVTAGNAASDVCDPLLPAATPALEACLAPN